MTADMLIEEGKKLIRPCRFLSAQRNGPIAAIWHERNDKEIEETGYRCWITVDARFIPGLPKPIPGFVSLFTNEEDCRSGRIEVVERPMRPGIQLFATEEHILPPLEAVFVYGSDAVGQWLTENDWPRNERYNDNFRNKEVTEAYQREWMENYPLYRQENELYAMLGGWHFPCADDDWYDLLYHQLLILTVHDSEPWVEGWRTNAGEFKVIQRIT